MEKIIFDVLESTNSYAKEIAEASKEDVLIVAKEQTGCRGRLGRKFSSPKGGVYMSFLLHPCISPLESSKLTVMAAVAVRRAIKNITGIDTLIKWVNDLYLNGKKLCGILTEGKLCSDNSRLSYAVVGIGLNLFYPENGFEDDIKDIATALYFEEKPQMYERLIDEIQIQFEKLYNDKNDGYLSEYKAHSFILGKEIEYVKDGVLYSARAVDINEKAELVVIKDGERLCLNSGEVKIKING